MECTLKIYFNTMNPYHIQSSNIDTLSPSLAITKITSIVCDMMQSNMDYVSKNGLTDSASKSRSQLLELLNITESFNTIAMTNVSLKNANHHLYLEIEKLKSELKQLENETNLANAI